MISWSTKIFGREVQIHNSECSLLLFALCVALATNCCSRRFIFYTNRFILKHSCQKKKRFWFLPSNLKVVVGPFACNAHGVLELWRLRQRIIAHVDCSRCLSERMDNYLYYIILKKTTTNTRKLSQLVCFHRCTTSRTTASVVATSKYALDAASNSANPARTRQKTFHHMKCHSKVVFHYSPCSFSFFARYLIEIRETIGIFRKTVIGRAQLIACCLSTKH